MPIRTSTLSHNSLTAHMARPDAPSDRGLLLLPMITGIGERVREFAADFAGAGITTVCWNPFPGASSDTHSLEELRQRRDELDDRTVLEELKSWLDHMSDELGVRRTATVGYCLGGRFALLLAAADPRIAGLVAYHPTVPPTPEKNHSIDPFEEAARVDTPVLVHYPGQDHLVPRQSMDRLRTMLEANTSASVTVSVHPEAGHGFSDSAHHGNEHNVAAYSLAQPLTLAFLRSTLAQ